MLARRRAPICARNARIGSVHAAGTAPSHAIGRLAGPPARRLCGRPWWSDPVGYFVWAAFSAARAIDSITSLPAPSASTQRTMVTHLPFSRSL